MDKKDLIEKIGICTSTVDFYKMKDEILTHLGGKEKKLKAGEN